jgi:hypothetical protein
MSSSPRTPPASGAFSRRFTAYAGLFFDTFESNSAWIRETATVRLPPLTGVRQLVVRGVVVTHPDARGLETGAPGLTLDVNGRRRATLTGPASGPWELRVDVPAAETVTLAFTLSGIGLTNLLAWLGRITG